MRVVILAHPVVCLITECLSYFSCKIIRRICLNGKHRGCFTFTVSWCQEI